MPRSSSHARLAPLLCPLIAALALAFSAAPAIADIITMRDGRVLEGVIISESSRLVEFDTKLNGIRTTMSLNRRQIGKIERKPLPDGFFEARPTRKPKPIAPASGSRKTESQQDPGAPLKDLPKGELDDGIYMSIPARGAIGHGVTASGIRKALAAAEKAQAKHIVFLIDSPGGYAHEALQIRAVLDEFRDRFTFHALIENQALSAATVLAAGSETIHARPIGTMGAATAYSTDADTGSAEVDAKFNSAWAASIASLASSRGHDEHPFRAMVIRDVELYVRHAGDRVVFAGSAPSSKSKREDEGWERLDDANTILTLTATQMAELNIAQLHDAGPEQLGSALGLTRWIDAGDKGARAMKTATQERVRLGEAIDGAIDALIESAEEAKREHPLRLTLVKWSGTLEITPKSQQDWTRSVSRSQSAWRRVQSAITRIERLKSKAEKIGALHLSIPDETVEEIREATQSQLDWLKRNGKAPRTTDEIPGPDD